MTDDDGATATATRMAGRAGETADPGGLAGPPDGNLAAEYFAYCEGFVETAHRSPS